MFARSRPRYEALRQQSKPLGAWQRAWARWTTTSSLSRCPWRLSLYLRGSQSRRMGGSTNVGTTYRTLST